MTQQTRHLVCMLIIDASIYKKGDKHQSRRKVVVYVDENIRQFSSTYITLRVGNKVNGIH